jgi:Protein of unknown function (DUF998)
MIHTAVDHRPGRIAAKRVAQVWPFIAVVGFAAFVSAVIAAGLGDPGYSALSGDIGGLGAQNAADPNVMNLGFLALAVATIAAGVGLFRLLPRRSGLGASMLVIAAGVGVAGLAVVQQDCSTAQTQCATTGLGINLSAAHTVHLVLAMCIVLALVVSLWMMVASLHENVGTEALASMTTWATVVTTGVFLWYGSEFYGVGIGGAVERLMTVLVYGWPVFLAVALTRMPIASTARAFVR